MPELSYVSADPGTGQIYMRGIAGGGGGFTGQQGAVAVYLNDQPISSPNGFVNWHMYDLNRVEVLPGPQGTLYGASSEAGTVRYITNVPDPSHFAGGYTTQINTINNGTLGGLAQGFINVPITEAIAARFVGWYERDSGFIDNVHQTITFANGTVIDNAPFVQKHYNPVTTEGGRAMFKFNIGDNWSINPTIQTQKTRWDGDFTQETWKALGDGTAIPSQLAVARFAPSTGDDSVTDYTLTVQGKIGNWDLTFSSGYAMRKYETYAEYVDYSLAYQQYEFGASAASSYYGCQIAPPGAKTTACWPSNPTMYDPRRNDYRNLSNELRISSPVEYPVRFVGGLYYDRNQAINYLQEPIPGLGLINPNYQVGYDKGITWKDTVYADYLESVFRDWAAYIQGNWDITKSLTATAGFRRFRYDNTIKGFYGYSAAYPLALFGSVHTSGEDKCSLFANGAYQLHGVAPCTDEDQESEGWGSTPYFSLAYKFTPDHMVYATFSKGFRPGGPNRTYGTVPYQPDYLTNYEIGWKTAWLDHHLIWNGSVYYEEWKNFQFSFTGANGIGVIANAGNAAVKGFDTKLQWAVGGGFSLTAAVTYTDSYLTTNYCSHLGSDGKPITTANCVGLGQPNPSVPLAFEGGRLQYSPLWKGFLQARYTHPLMNGTGFAQLDQTYQSFMWTNLEPRFQRAYGPVPAYGLTNISFGLDKDNWELELLVTNLFNRIALVDTTPELQAAAAIALFNPIAPTRLIGLQFSQNF